MKPCRPCSILETELHQESRTQADLDAAFEWLCLEFERRGLRWWLAGSGALYARGLAVKPHDLDVMLEKSDIYRIAFAFEPEDWVDGQGPVDFGPYARERVEPMVWRGHEILVPPIELQIAPNEARGRHERVEMIRKYLGNEKGAE